MKEYLKYISIRIGIACLFMAAMYFLNAYLYGKTHAQLFEGVKDIIVGDSHFNGLAIDNVKHLGQDSEVYYTMFQKVKEVNEISPLENVIMSYSYLNFSKNYFDDFLLSNDVQAFSISKRNYPLASLWDQLEQSKYFEQLVKVLARFNFSLNFNYLRNKQDVKKNLPFMWFQDDLTKKRDLEFLKKLQDRRKRKIDPSSRRYKNQIAAKIERLFANDEEAIATINLSYLEKLMDYCASNEIKVWLISTPLESSYDSAIPEYMKSAFKSYTDNLLQKYPNAQFLDYTHKFQDPDYFQDEHHVAVYGAALLSIDIENEIRGRR